MLERVWCIGLGMAEVSEAQQEIAQRRKTVTEKSSFEIPQSPLSLIVAYSCRPPESTKV